MPFDPQHILNSPSGLRLVSFLGRSMPARIGHRLSNFVADQISARREWDIVRAVRLNQWVASRETLGNDALDQAVRLTIRSIARSFFDLYHYVDNLKAIQRLIVLDPVARDLVRRPEYSPQGLVVAGLHLSNFDLVLQTMFLQKMKAIVLTIPEPQGGHRLQFEMRKRTGMNLIPASINALRQAVMYLKAGGVVLTGMDRPIPEPGLHPQFFGRPSSLPTHHIHLALNARVPVLVMAAMTEPDGTYHVHTSDLIEMQSHPDREAEILQNAEAVLKIAEQFIQKAPQQWAMTLPVWPDLLEQVPH
jgi:lauroyl/myristoyl acyltransferase